MTEETGSGGLTCPHSAVKSKICSEILEIIGTYHEQESSGNIGSPGGLEHMGDVWRLLERWESELTATK